MIDINPEIIDGIYFLFFKKKCVYIGKSVCVITRILQHKKKGDIVFDNASCVPIPVMALDEIKSGFGDNRFLKDYLEQYWIDRYKPKYNKTNDKTLLSAELHEIANEYFVKINHS